MIVQIVDRVVGEVKGMPPVGAPRGVLVDGIAALGRMRAAVEAAEARFVAAIDSLGDKRLDAAAIPIETVDALARATAQ